jgi:hypothetical protein
MKNYELQNSLIKKYIESLQALKEHGILNNKKDFTSQIGEWLVCELFDGEMAPSSIQKDWDMIIGDKKVQVKAHSKATTNPNRKTYLDYELGCDIDELIIVVFNETYSLQELYRVPWEVVCQAKEFNKKRREIYWSTLNEFKLDLVSIENQSVLELFT